MDVDTAIEIHLTSNQMLAESGEFDLLSGNIASLLVSLIRCLECAADSIEELSTPEVAQRVNFVSGEHILAHFLKAGRDVRICRPVRDNDL
jgi:hypothetical protein